MILTLTDLPAELTEAVAGAGDKRNVLALRCVSRKLRDNTEFTFIENFFVSRRHALTKHSLRVLLQILESPYLGKKLRSLELVVLGNVSRKEEGEPGSNLAERAARKAEIEEQRRRRVTETGSTLSQIFTNIATAEIALDLRVSGFPHQLSQEIYGYSTFLRSFASYEVETKFSRSTFDSHLYDIQRSLHGSRLAMTAFTITGRHTFLSFSKRFITLQGWSNLRTLRLTPDIHKSGIGRPPYDNAGLKEVVGIATNLEELTLEGVHYPWYTDHDYEHWLRHLTSMFSAARLKSVTLKGSTYSSDVLKSFLLGQKSTLVNLKIKGRGVGAESDQASMRRWLQSELDLTEDSGWEARPAEEDRPMYRGWNISVSKNLA